jgi:hypothetical protein
MSEEQIARLHGDILYILQNEGQDTGDQENIVDDSLFGDGDDETVEVPDDSVPTADVDESETSGTGTETGGVLFEYLKSLIEKIKKDIVNFSQPECYRNGTFWHHPHDAIFALEASRLTPSGINPRELYHRDVFIWLLGLPTRLPGEPEMLHCPTCQRERGKHTHLIRKGLLIELGIHCSWYSIIGYNTDPLARRVKGLHRDYFLLTNRLECVKSAGGCGSKFQGTDPMIISQLSHVL